MWWRINVPEHLKDNIKLNLRFVVFPETIAQWLEEYHQAKLKDELPTEEEIRDVLMENSEAGSINHGETTKDTEIIAYELDIVKASRAITKLIKGEG
jgi:hypothetical protein